MPKLGPIKRRDLIKGLKQGKDFRFQIADFGFKKQCNLMELKIPEQNQKSYFGVFVQRLINHQITIQMTAEGQ